MSQPRASLNSIGRAMIAAATVLPLFMLLGCVRLVSGVMDINPGRSTRMTIEKGIMVEMRDGVRLSTNVYRPAGEGKYPVILTRLPYGKDNTLFAELAKLFTRNGYVFMVQDTRGEHASEGVWFPMLREADDGRDTIAWITRQPWYNGKIGMFGGSYFGYTQLVAAPDDPALTCMVPLVASGNIKDVIYRGGALEDITWSGWLAGERTAQLKRLGKPGEVKPDFTTYFNDPIRDAVPLDMARLAKDPAALAAGPEAYLKHPGDIESLASLSYDDNYAKVSAPPLFVAGWYDLFIGPELNDFTRFRAEGQGQAREARIIIGPWIHGIFFSKFESSLFGGLPLVGSSFMAWYDHYLKGAENGIEKQAPLKIFVMGENVWRDENEWPLSRTVFTDYYLHSGGRANTEKGDGRLELTGPAEEPADSYDYDPRNPVPTAGGCFLGFGDYPAGAKDQGRIPLRPDVLVYMTGPLARPVEVTGPIQLRLDASSSAKDTDFVAKLLDVDEKGKPRLLQEGIIRARYRNGYQHPSALVPGQAYAYAIDMWATSNLFLAGHRIALWVTSSDFPQFDRNANAGGEGGPNNIVIAHQTIYHDAQHPSRLTLPVIPR